jgi:hypothetical protein
MQNTTSVERLANTVGLIGNTFFTLKLGVVECNGTNVA